MLGKVFGTADNMGYEDKRLEQHVPTWDGQASTLTTYAEEVDLFVKSLKVDARERCCAQLVRRLPEGPARTVAHSRLESLQCADGYIKYLQLLEDVVGATPTSLLAMEMETMVAKLHKDQNESMTAWIAKVWKTHNRLCKAMTRMQKDQVSDARNTARRSSWSSWMASAEASVDVPPEAEESHERSWEHEDWEYWRRRWDWVNNVWEWEKCSRPTSSTSTSASSGASTTGASRSTSLGLPDMLLGWLLLWRAGLTSSEKAAVLAATRGQLGMEVVAEALKNQYPETVHHAGQRHHKKHGYRNSAYAAEVVQEEEMRESEKPEQSDEGESAPDEEDVVLEEMAQEALIAYRAAHRQLQDRKLSRGYYKKAPPGAKSKDGTKNVGDRVRPAGGKPEAGKETRRCFKCGSSLHLARDCPDRAAPKQAAAHFVEHLALFSEEVYVNVMDRDRQGSVILDSGATQSVAGWAAAEGLWSVLQEHDTNSELELDHSADARTLFKFGGGECQRSLGVAKYSFTVGGKPVSLSVSVLDTPATPVLLSAKTLQRLRAQVDFEQGTLRSRLFDREFPLVRATTGHLWLDIRCLADSHGSQP